MKVTALLFRFRVAIMVMLNLIGFAGGRQSTLWLRASTLVARAGGFDLAAATLAITLLGLGCLLASAALRVWGTAYLGPAVMRHTAMQGEQLTVAGPYAYLRNPLYLGTWLLGLATSLLMPTDSAAFFLAAYSGFLLFLIAAEERFLAARIGEPYLQYRRQVPRLWPRVSAHVVGSPAKPRWLSAILSETIPVGFTLCYAIFAWRYNAHLLIRCLLICFGLSLVFRAFRETANDTNAPEP